MRPPRPENTSRYCQVIDPHPVKLVPIRLFQLWPVFVKVFDPSVKRPVVVRSKIVPVFNNELSFGGFCYVLGEGKVAVRKNVGVEPGFTAGHFVVV